MAKAVAEREKQELTTEIQMDPELLQQIDQDLGKGVSTDVADNLVPLIYVLQPLSPQVLDGPMHMDDAKAGDIWLKNFAETPIVSGKEGIWFMPCAMYQKWTEWIPRTQGGGFVASYDYNGGKLPEGAVRDEDEKKRPKYFFPDTGHDCVDTRYEAGMVWYNGQPYPYVIPFKSTGHKISRGWMTTRTSLLKRGVNGGPGGVWPAWSHVYKLTTKMEKNTQGQWFNFNIGSPNFYIPGFQDKPHKVGLEVIGGDPNRAYVMGRALAQAFESGAKREMEEDHDADIGAGTGEETTASNGRVDDNIPY